MESTLTAPALSAGEKFQTRITQTFGPYGFLGVGLGAAIAHARNVPEEWGQGFEGYATRYGSAFGTSLSRQTMAIVLESALHEDPRYFPSREKGFGLRFKNVLKQSILTRTDSGKFRFAFSRYTSAFGAGQLANTWQPKSNGRVQDGLERGVITLGADAAVNFLQEFIPFMRNRAFKH